MGREIVSFELRPKKDDDISDALKREVEKYAGTKITQSDIIREALRAYLIPTHTAHVASSHQPPLNPIRTSFIEPQSTHIELQKAEKDDTQLDAALDDLLNFDF